MIFYPAIDLKQGTCVRLQQGNMMAATLYNHDPAAQAQHFQELGFEWLHVIDLDGAFAGQEINHHAIQAIVQATSNPIQLGGGIRTLAQIEKKFEQGVARIILGTIAVTQPAIVREACKLFPGKIAVSIDARKGQVAVSGWSEPTPLDIFTLASHLEEWGVACIIYTDIERDGLLQGINWETTFALARHSSIPVIASGGLASITDLDPLFEPDAPQLQGIISGRALYDGTIHPKEALKKLKSLQN